MAGHGRVPRGEFTGKTAVLSTRIRQDTREALQAAAIASGKSLSQEIEFRLRRSFDKDDSIRAECGNRRNYGVLKLMAAIFELAPNETASWLDDTVNFNHTVAAAMQVLIALRPPGASLEMSDVDRWFGAMNAGSVADAWSVRTRQCRLVQRSTGSTTSKQTSARTPSSA